MRNNENNSRRLEKRKGNSVQQLGRFNVKVIATKYQQEEKNRNGYRNPHNDNGESYSPQNRQYKASCISRTRDLTRPVKRRKLPEMTSSPGNNNPDLSAK